MPVIVLSNNDGCAIARTAEARALGITRWGRGAVVPARAGLVAKRGWNTKFEMRTPRYTTQVGELPVAHA